MMDAAYIVEQNKMDSTGAWIWLLQILTPKPGYDDLYYTSNNTLPTTTWPIPGGDAYWPMPMHMDDVEVSTSGKFPEYHLQLDDVALDSKLRNYIRNTGGLVGSTVRMMVVHSNHLILTIPAIDECATILDCEVTVESISFTIGIPSLLGKRFPRDRYVPGFCRHKFAGAMCEYIQPSNSYTTIQSMSFVVGATNSLWFSTPADIVQSFFRFAPGTPKNIYNWALLQDTPFTVTGSIYNDGYFIADSYYEVQPNFVCVKSESGGGRLMTAESVASGLKLRLGYGLCDHTLVDCRQHNNSQNYGGSPGIIGGAYG